MADDVAATLAAARAVGVERVVHVGCAPDSMARAVELAAAHDDVYAVVGVHPHEARLLDDEVFTRLEALLDAPKVVALGETGLDYHYDRSPRDVQREALARQADLAARKHLPLVLHVRDAHEDALEVLAGVDLPRGGIVHCFTGDAATARAWLDRGFHVSFSGIVTFPKAPEVAEAARVVPDDRLLLETDAPYLAPVPVRGRKNTPANVAFTCAFVARLRGVPPEELAHQTALNAQSLLNLPAGGA
ncbi:MAG: TatD family deoxyribonuclease [Deltaproteobacteria bacterium]|nr:MAG: TatD family deoxyribonuclease [Deltaproteobacteria bacterium]